jgi:hypothetical protein
LSPGEEIEVAPEVKQRAGDAGAAIIGPDARQAKVEKETVAESSLARWPAAQTKNRRSGGGGERFTGCFSVSFQKQFKGKTK